MIHGKHEQLYLERITHTSTGPVYEKWLKFVYIYAVRVLFRLCVHYCYRLLVPHMENICEEYDFLLGIYLFFLRNVSSISRC